MTGQHGLDTYICFGAADAGWVRVLAGHLFDADLIAFLDPWHADSADVLALRTNQGYRQSRCVVLVVGPGADATVLARFRTMLDAPDGPPVVVVAHGDVTVPDLPAGRELVDFRGTDTSTYPQRVGDLVRVVGPPLDGHPRPRSGRRSVLLRVGGERVACTVGDGAPDDGAPDDGVADVAADITVDWHRFDALLWSRQRREPEALRAIGTALGATFTPDPVGRSIEDAASAAYADGGTLTIGVTADGDLGELPWETLILPGHDEPLAVHPATRIYRTHDSSDLSGPPPAGPLRILAVLAGPDSLVDYERGLATLLDAVEPARKYHGARVRILTEGTSAAIEEELAVAGPYHVLHLSCHARPGALLLEDGSELTPAFAAAIGSGPPASRVRMVVLSGAWTAQTAPGVDTLSALARDLLAAGVPQVLVMTAPATDRFATALFASVYRELALATVPEALSALTHARRDAEHRRRAEVAATGRAVPAEWATPALYQHGRPGPLYHPLTSPATGAPAMPGFVGRRDDLRRLLAVLRQPDRPAVLLHGMAGVGKSALAAAAVRRMGSDAGAVVALTGSLTADRLLTSVGRALGAAALADPGREFAGRLDALADAPALVLLDSMEANLVRTGDDRWVLADPRLAEVLSRLAGLGAVGHGALVMTSRRGFDLPGGQRLWRQHVGPLSWSEARLLMWRLRALDTLSLADQNKSYVDSGGHPGTLEVLDALLRRPGASFADLRQRMERLLLDRKIDRPDLWMAQVGRPGVDTSLAEAVATAVYDDLRSDAAQPVLAPPVSPAPPSAPRSPDPAPPLSPI